MSLAFSLVFAHSNKFDALRQNKKPPRGWFSSFIEVPDILISNELLEDMRKLADLYDYFKLTGAD